MTLNSSFPDWFPRLEKDAKILVVGASGGIGQALVKMFLDGPSCMIGAHRSTSKPLLLPSETPHKMFDLQADLKADLDCQNLVNDFVDKAGGITGLVVLCGGISRSAHWNELTEKEWTDDINLNLSIPFYLSRAAMKHMNESSGQIVLTGTESSLHGGGPTALPYGVAKMGVECLVKGLAREGAERGVLINGIRFGFIKSGFHERWQGKSDDDLLQRAQMVPLNRGGEPEEAAALIIYLLSGWAKFITGQMFSISGGDWL